MAGSEIEQNLRRFGLLAKHPLGGSFCKLRCKLVNDLNAVRSLVEKGNMNGGVEILRKCYDRVSGFCRECSSQHQELLQLKI